MVRVAILVPEMAVLAAIADPRYMFTAVNDLLQQSGKTPVFDVQLIGLSASVHQNDGVYTVQPDVVIGDARNADLVIVPALMGDLQLALVKNAQFLPWIVEQYRNGAVLASLCLGAFMLASTGLLDGQKCSTHWLFAAEFRRMFPNVELVDDKIITEQNRIFTSGGAHSYWNLLLYLVERYTSREMAMLASKFFVIEPMRNSQSPFIIFKAQREHKDENVRKAQDYIELHYDERIAIDDLARFTATGRRSLERRFKAATNNTIAEYIQRVKVEAAKKTFETTRQNINEVMYAVGYTDAKAFRNTFKKVTGVSPVEYRNKFCR